MKLKTLMNALEHYMISADCNEIERQDAISALLSCQSVRERFESSEIFSDEIYVVTADMLSTLLNVATYDEYGRRAQSYKNEKLPFSSYAYACRKDYWLYELTDEQLQIGYDIIGDLWCDNKASGANNPNGTFKTKEHEVIKDALPWIVAYQLTSGEFLEDDKAREKLQSTVDKMKAIVE